MKHNLVLDRNTVAKQIDHWMECIDKGDIFGTLFVDFRKAFDLVDHSVLLSKHHLYKFSRSLSNRHQAVAFNNGLSDFEHVRSGVPQGSILGPTLFLIFTNDLPVTLKHCKSDFYAIYP